MNTHPKNPGRPKPDDTPPRDTVPVLLAEPDTDWSDLRPDVICRPTAEPTASR